MPRRAGFRIPAVSDLLRQLSYAPPDTRLRQMLAAERFIAEMDRETAYPASFVVYRVTGFRTDAAGAPDAIAGATLVPDLVNFVERLSEELELRDVDRPGGARPLEAWATRFRVTVRTLQRRRADGLLFHWIGFADGTRRVGLYAECVERFSKSHPELLRGDALTHLTPDERARLVREAAELRRERNCSLHHAASELAARHGRAIETVRRALHRHNARSGSPIFPDRAKVDTEERAAIMREWRGGATLAQVAVSVGRSVPSVHRHLAMFRRERLAAWPLAWIELPTFDMPEAQAVILGAPAVREGLVVEGFTDALELVEGVRARPALGKDGIDAVLGAFNYLKRHVADSILRLGPAPRSEALERIETCLRWIARLKATAVAALLPASLARVEAFADGAIKDQPADEIRRLVTLACEVVADALEKLDPTRSQRPDRVIALATDKALARTTQPARRTKAATRLGARAVPIDDPSARLCPWQSELDPPAGAVERLAAVPEPMRTAVRMRHGLDGRAPCDPAAIAKALRITAAGATRLAQQGEAALRGSRHA